ncbi:MAG: hypothetical protein HUK21_11245 [Fibrobacteraceae bacterium]|nr:hypothetical protein [Fibrobacteraceae bacterium]
MKKIFAALWLIALTFNTACSDDSSTNATSGTESWRDYCVDKINEYRATENVAPLKKADVDKQKCVTKQAANDLSSNKAHGHFGDCGEHAQNSGPNISMGRYKSNEEIIDSYLDMMWSEKKLVESGARDPDKVEDYPYIGHYLNMKTTAVSVACGIATNSDETIGWLNINFH